MATQNQKNYKAAWNRSKAVSIRDVGAHLRVSAEKLRIKKKMRDSFLCFLQKCLPDKFPLKFSKAHFETIDIIETAIKEGGRFAFALPRGSGKTTIIMGAALWAVLNGWRRYLVIIAADQGASEKLMEGIKATLETNDNLAAYYPEATHYLRALQGVSQRAAGQLSNGAMTGIRFKKDHFVFADFEADPKSLEFCNQAVIEGRGLTGRLRGMQQTLLNGSVIRPDFIVLDDPQTTESALSPGQCKDREFLIESDVLGLGGAGKELAGFMTCTVIRADDLAERFLKKWRSLRIPMFIKFPSKELIEEYVRIRREAVKTGAEKKLCNKFYREHKKDFDKAKTYWEQRKNYGEISAVQHGMNLLADVGEISFYCEYQNDPLEQKTSFYKIDELLVMSRLNGFKRREIPPDCLFVCAGIDVNYYALSWAIAAVQNDRTAFLVDYGQYPGNGDLWNDKSTIPAEQAIYNGILNLAGQLKAQNPEIEILACDGNYATDTVYRALAQVQRLRQFRYALPARGVSSKAYFPPKTGDRQLEAQGDNWHRARAVRGGSHIVFNSHHWHMLIQKGFLLNPGMAGSVSLFGNQGADHRKIAMHICADKLESIEARAGKEIHEWTRKATERNDLSDAVVISIAAAASFGADVNKPKQAPAPQVRRGLNLKFQTI